MEICSWWKLSFNDAETKPILNLKYIKDSRPHLISHFSQLSIIVYQIPYFESQDFWKNIQKITFWAYIAY